MNFRVLQQVKTYQAIKMRWSMPGP